MNETYVTVVGYVGTEPDERMAGTAMVTKFRIASTPRTYSTRDNQWTDRETSWYTVNAWRTLGHHCMESLRIGDPVIVHGRQSAQSWKDDAGNPRTTMVIEATAVGHDLSRGASAFVKDVKEGKEEPSAEDQALAQDNASLEGTSGQVTSDGRFPEPALAAPF